MELQEKELYWLAGILEGEGSFIPQREKYPCQISIQMSDEDIIAKIANIFNVSYHSYYPQKSIDKGWKKVYSTTLRGFKSIELMRKLQPLMGIRRSNKIQECIDSFYFKPTGKLTKNDELLIYSYFKNGLKPKEIAKLFPITHWRVYQVIRKYKEGEFV